MSASRPHFAKQSPNLARRTVVKGLMAGVAASATLPRKLLAKSLREVQASPELLWQSRLPDGYESYGSLILAAGTIVAPGRVNSQGMLTAVDPQTHQLHWSVRHEGFYTTPVFWNGMLYAASTTGELDVIDVNTGNTLRTLRNDLAGQLQIIGGNLIFPTASGEIVSLGLNGEINWRFATGDSGQFNNTVVTAVVVAQTLVIGLRDTAYALNFSTGELLWKFEATDALSSLNGSGTSVFVGTRSSIVALDSGTGTSQWSWPPTSLGNLGAAVVCGDTLYVTSSAGGFYAISVQGGAGWQINLHAGLSNNIYIEDGIAYTCTLPPAAPEVFAIDLASRGAEVLSVKTLQVSDIIGVQNGIVYVEQESTAPMISAYNFTYDIHSFFCRSKLMAEDYEEAPTGGHRGKTSSYRTQIRLLDENFNPRIAVGVKIWASSETTLLINGVDYPVGPTSNSDGSGAAFLQTDSTGEVSMVISATDLSCPAIYLWSNFMGADECMVVYPDFDTQNTLASVNSDQLLAAKSYDGNAMLPDDYANDEDSVAALANTISNTMAGGSGPALTRKRSILNKTRFGSNSRGPETYVAYPGSTPNLLYQSKIGDTGLPYGTAVVANWEAEFSASGMSFRPTVPPAQLSAAVGLNVHDLLKNVVHGAENVTKMTYNTVGTVVKTVVHTVVDGVEKIYEVIVTVLDEAATLVAAVLKTVIGAIKKAVEWLSYLLNWDDILETKDIIKDDVRQQFRDLKSWAQLQADNGFKDLHKAVKTITTPPFSAHYLVNLGSRSVTGSIESQEVDHNNPQTGYDAGGADCYAQSRYLPSKVTANGDQATLSDASLLRLRDSNTLEEAFTAFLGDVRDAITHNAALQSIPSDLEKFFANFAKLFTDPTQFVKNSLHDILQLMLDIADALVGLLDAVIESFLNMLLKVIDIVIDSFDVPIKIPVVSELWRIISGGAMLTVLDLSALMIAVPSTIVWKVANSGDGKLRGIGTIQRWVAYFAMYFQGLFFGIQDIGAFGPASPMVRITTAISFISVGSSFPADLAANSDWTYVLYALRVFPLLFALNNAIGSEKKWAVAVRSRAPSILCGYGVLTAIVSTLLGFLAPEADRSPFQGKDYTLMTANILQCMPFVIRPTVCGPPADPGRVVAGVIDVVFFSTVSGLRMLYEPED